MNSPESLKEINILKKRLSWGELPPFYHMIANSVAELEGIHTHGFEHPLKRLINRQNWNLDRLKGKMDLNGEIQVERKPKLTLYRKFHDGNYEIHCAPTSQGGPVFVYAKGDPFIDFRVWDPATMGCILRLPKFADFIVHAYRKGDEADRILIKYTSDIIDNLLTTLASEVDIEEYKGQSIKDVLSEIEDTLKK
ncbi:hypothetical protein KIH87_08410 [Paraneptunicella aestuarii]|uniref:hypothetical protein n=1 Tax=Paraneptunicella aestuarii TaxID=2831148 RepID=UPI001E30CF52|nr:hypothetical protein [Paraneptunicella aestuarii]UAA40340.1 hypothetical protein KIH87_08410 [Paraneptunicella aestuarii]